MVTPKKRLRTAGLVASILVILVCAVEFPISGFIAINGILGFLWPLINGSFNLFYLTLALVFTPMCVCSGLGVSCGAKAIRTGEDKVANKAIIFALVGHIALIFLAIQVSISQSIS